MSAAPQRGFSLFFALIALAILLVAGVSIMRSSGLNLYSSGSAGFKQDIVARADVVNVRIFALMRTGGDLAAEASLANSSVPHNYSALALDSNDQGIPLALINDTVFATVGQSSNDISDDVSKTNIRYVIERLCDQQGLSETLGRSHCLTNPESNAVTGGSSTQASSAIPSGLAPTYRVSARVRGPRGAEAYLQSTFTKPN